MVLRPGNSKLGKLVHHWSLPAVIASVCVCASDLCRKLCYAAQGFYNYDNVKKALAENHKESLRPDFPVLVQGWLRVLFVRVLRIHASGEFYSAAYVKKWIEIVRKSPNVEFYAYTRSWRRQAILTQLQVLSELPNMTLWFSCDQETGQPPAVPGVRTAYLMIGDDDIPAFPVDLVFRDKDKTMLKWVGSAIVCPAENGVTKTTCSTCQLCFRSKPLPQRKPHVGTLVDHASLPVLQTISTVPRRRRKLQTVG
jgi:hypothetical protein